MSGGNSGRWDNFDTPSCTFDLEPHWADNADEMGVSKAEWARRMIRLGRRQWGLPYNPDDLPETTGIQTEQDERSDTDHLRQFLIANLSTDDYIDPEELAEIVMDEIEETADDLEKDGIVESSYRHGFKLTGDWQTKLEDNDA
jgi:hypothetical protein